ncbi:MAG: hypothetical protein IJ736_04840, partial [Firmicutes bacterium]|nr:hypothetical protein [Bacillota bacterium]
LDNKAEVKHMCITEYDEEKVLAAQRKEGRKEGAINLIKLGKLTLDEIAETMKLSVSEVIELEEQLKQLV